MVRGIHCVSSLLAVAVTAHADDASVRLMTLDPGHFHAALIQKEMYPEVAETVHVYAPLGKDLLAHLGRVSAFNSRAENPTRWRLEVHAGPDARARMVHEKPGNVVVLSGRNRTKIDDLLACVQAGLSVLADKPWIVEAADFPKLERALDTAAHYRVVAYDVMTERYEVTTLLQRELMQDAAVVGTIGSGSEAEPAIEMESVHQLMKVVAGAVNLRPVWFFDTREQGEALADVGTHLVDLVQWMLYPGQAIDYRSDVRVLTAKRWPTVLDRGQLVRLTGEKQLDPALAALMQGDRLDYFANGEVSYTVRGTHARVRVAWNYDPEAAGDTHHAVVCGSRARLEILQGAEQNWRPELYVVPLVAAERAAIRSALDARLAVLAKERPGLAVQDEGGRLRVVIPDRDRVGHESHFGEVTRRFLGYLEDPSSIPRWEQANMLAKYYVTTQAVELSRRAAPLP